MLAPVQVLHLHDHSALAWMKLPAAVGTGKHTFEAAYGKPLFNYLRDQSDDEVLFSKAMTEIDGLGEAQTGSIRSRLLRQGITLSS